MFDFAYPSHLYLMGAVVLLAVLYFWARASRRNKLRRFGRPEIIAALMPDASRYKPVIKIVLTLTALTMIVFILARPRFSGEQNAEEATSSGIEIMIAFDVSNSMLASSNDAPDGISRLDRARLLLEKLIGKLDNDKVGLIVYAGEAKTQLPLTTDFYTARIYLNELNPNMIAFQGTDISQAMDMAMNSFTPTDDVHKAIILITDAEDHEGDAVATAKRAAEAGIQVDVIGLGSAKGAPIPVQGKRGEYLRDAEGQVVTTSVNEQLGQEIAAAGNGIYVNGASSSALNDLTAQLDRLGKSQFKSVKYTAAAEQFPIFAWMALALLIIDVFILDRKIGWLKKINFFSK